MRVCWSWNTTTVTLCWLSCQRKKNHTQCRFKKQRLPSSRTLCVTRTLTTLGAMPRAQPRLFFDLVEEFCSALLWAPRIWFVGLWKPSEKEKEFILIIRCFESLPWYCLIIRNSQCKKIPFVLHLVSQSIIFPSLPPVQNTSTYWKTLIFICAKY